MKPILKWAGGKRQLLPVIKDNLPSSYNTYIEPFFGGGAVLFNLEPTDAIINDINSEIINVYNTIKTDCDDLIKELKKYKNDEDEYYKIRNLDRNNDFDKLSNVKKAARIIYLNRTCFNGLYRVNKSNQNNVPFGKYKNPLICDEKNLKEISVYLKKNDILIYNGDFSKVIEKAKSHDFVYLDPPYDPINKQSFVSYSKDGFSQDDQKKLKKLCDKLNEKGVYFMVSNSCTEFIKDLYKDYKIIEIDARRSIAASCEDRKSVKEVIIKNY